MNGFYPECFVVRLIICIAGMFCFWCLALSIAGTFIRHEPSSLSSMGIVVPIVAGTRPLCGSVRMSDDL